jgi:hypothetical protein
MVAYWSCAALLIRGDLSTLLKKNANDAEWVTPVFFQSRSPRWFAARWCSDTNSVQGISPEPDELTPIRKVAITTSALSTFEKPVYVPEMTGYAWISDKFSRTRSLKSMTGRHLQKKLTA